MVCNGLQEIKEFMAKIQRLQKDPNSLTQMLSDPRIMEVLGLVVGDNDEEEDEEEEEVEETCENDPFTFGGSTACEETDETEEEASDSGDFTFGG